MASSEAEGPIKQKKQKALTIQEPSVSVSTNFLIFLYFNYNLVLTNIYFLFSLLVMLIQPLLPLVERAKEIKERLVSKLARQACPQIPRKRLKRRGGRKL